MHISYLKVSVLVELYLRNLAVAGNSTVLVLAYKKRMAENIMRRYCVKSLTIIQLWNSIDQQISICNNMAT